MLELGPTQMQDADGGGGGGGSCVWASTILMRLRAKLVPEREASSLTVLVPRGEPPPALAVTYASPPEASGQNIYYIYAIPAEFVVVVVVNTGDIWGRKPDGGRNNYLLLYLLTKAPMYPKRESIATRGCAYSREG